MALLSALCAVESRMMFFCLHVEHGLRPAEESCGDADFVRAFCEEHGVECRVEHIPPGKIASLAQRKGIGIEAAARFFRHKALAREAARLEKQTGKKTRILIAHSKDDLLETALMRTLRGCGPAGLAIMPVNRGRILRPLLDVSRSEIIAYLTAKKIPWREDITNKDEKFLRNKIRCRFVPMLDETFPSWKAGVTAMAETQVLVAEFISNEAKQRVKWESNRRNFFSADAENFFAQPLIVREEALFQVIDVLLKNVKNLRTVKRSVVRRFCKQQGAVSAVDLGSVMVRLEKGKVLLSRKQKEFFESGVSVLIKK